MKFKVEIRISCKICNKPLKKKYYRTYCSATCRYKRNNQKNKDYQREWQINKRGQFSDDKKQCLICGKWYVQIGTHSTQTHKTTAREYKKEFDLPLTHGLIPDWYKKIKSEQALENNMDQQLIRTGFKTRYIKNDPKAKLVTGWKGRAGNKGYQEL